jgi:hypothetical protein
MTRTKSTSLITAGISLLFAHSGSSQQDSANEPIRQEVSAVCCSMRPGTHRSIDVTSYGAGPSPHSAQPGLPTIDEQSKQRLRSGGNRTHSNDDARLPVVRTDSAAGVLPTSRRRAP